MYIKKEIIIPCDQAGKRIDQALAHVFPEYSRARLQEWLKQGKILINGRSIRAKDKVQGGEQVVVSVEIQNKVQAHAQAEDYPLEIIYEDEHLLVINKPVGLVVHPGAGNTQGTLLNALLHHAPQVQHLPRAGIVHRLDKETSGLLVVAKSLPARTSLVSQLQARTVKREYEAVVVGVLISGGTIDEPIGRHPAHRTKMAVTQLGKEAITHVRVLEKYRAHTRILATLETGRTHQIRVHLAHTKYPLVGDRTYGYRLALPKGITSELAETLRGFQRQALHARRLSLVHPISKQLMKWEVKPPQDMQYLINCLREDNHNMEAFF